MMCTMQNHIIQVFANSGNVIKPIGVLNELKSKWLSIRIMLIYTTGLHKLRRGCGCVCVFFLEGNFLVGVKRLIFKLLVVFINFLSRCIALLICMNTGIAKHFRYGSQEDAHEFLRYTVDAMQKSCLPGTK